MFTKLRIARLRPMTGCEYGRIVNKHQTNTDVRISSPHIFRPSSCYQEPPWIRFLQKDRQRCHTKDIYFTHFQNCSCLPLKSPRPSMPTLLPILVSLLPSYTLSLEPSASCSGFPLLSPSSLPYYPDPIGHYHYHRWAPGFQTSSFKDTTRCTQFRS
jgi:hypothetical protein